jgi:PAS domain S-box-containing protein
MTQNSSCSPGSDAQKMHLTGPRRWVWVAFFVVLTSVLLAGGYAYYRSELDRIQKEKYEDLAAIAELKAGQIREWRRERLADVEALSRSSLFKRTLEGWLRDRKNEALLAELKDRLVAERQIGRYGDTLLLSPDGHALLSAQPHTYPLSPVAKVAIEEALAKSSPVLSAIYRNPRGAVLIDAVAPMLDQKGKPIAAVICRSNARSLLYPLIQSWLASRKTDETLLIRKEGDGVLFLNELRHRPNTALSLREPFTLASLPAVQAVQGKKGMFQGRDYRGVDVLADLRPIPDSPWFMVAKVDTSEISAEARYRGGMIALFSVLFILLAAGMTAYGYRYRQVRLYRDLYRLERQRRAAQEEFRTTLYSIGDAVITTDTAGLVKQMNPTAERLTGWPEAEAKGKPLDEVFRIVSEDSREEVENLVQRVLNEGKVIGLANHTLLIARDGSESPIADSGAPLRDEAGGITGVVLVFRDLTEQARTEKALKQSEVRYRSLFENIGSAVVLYKAERDGEDFIFVDLNRPQIVSRGQRVRPVRGTPKSVADRRARTLSSQPLQGREDSGLEGQLRI